MSEYKKYMQNAVNSPVTNSEQQRTNRRGTNNKSSKSKDVKNRLHCIKSKQTYLTDTQSSDYTKLSNDCGISTSTDTLADTIKKLKQQNNLLKQQILQIKSSQFFNINQGKLKDIISQNQKLKNQLTKIKKLLDDSFVERDFLERFNKNLKTQCEQLTRQVLKVTKDNQLKNQEREDKSIKDSQKNVKFQDNSKRVERYSIKYLQEMTNSRNSHRSQQRDERKSYRNQIQSKSKNKGQQKLLLKSRSTSRIMENQYFIGKGLKDSYRQKKQRKNNDE